MKDWKNICEFEDMKPINKSLLETGRNKKVSSEMKGLEKLEKKYIYTRIRMLLG